MLTLEQRRKKDDRERLQSMRILAEEFGHQRGWLRSKTAFSLEQLRRRSNKIRVGEDTAFNTDTVFYRERQRPFHPAAIAAHYPTWPEIGPELEQVCERYGLRCEAVVDFPNWIDGAQLVVYTPAAKATPRKKAARKGARCPTQMKLPFN